MSRKSPISIAQCFLVCAPSGLTAQFLHRVEIMFRLSTVATAFSAASVSESLAGGSFAGLYPAYPILKLVRSGGEEETRTGTETGQARQLSEENRGVVSSCSRICQVDLYKPQLDFVQTLGSTALDARSRVPNCLKPRTTCPAFLTTRRRASAVKKPCAGQLCELDSLQSVMFPS